MNYTLFSYRWFIKITISFPLNIIHYHTQIPTKVSEMK